MIELHRFPVFPFPPPGCRTRCAMVVALALLVLAPALPHSRQWPTGRSSRATCSCSSSREQRICHLPIRRRSLRPPGCRWAYPTATPPTFLETEPVHHKVLEHDYGLKNKAFYAFAVLERNARFERRYPLLFYLLSLVNIVIQELIDHSLSSESSGRGGVNTAYH